MRCLCLLCCMIGLHVSAQEWAASFGAYGVADIFLKDKTLQPKKARLPVSPGAMVGGGIRYTAGNGFDAYLDLSGGFTTVRYPVPDIRRYDAYFNVFSMRLTAGTGPRLPLGTSGNSITPFLKLGAAHFRIWDQSARDESNGVLVERRNGAFSQASWTILCAAGIDWRFDAALPSAIGLQFSYTPQNVLREPVGYLVTTLDNQYDLQLQGRMAQVALSYSLYWRFRRAPAY